MSSRSIAWLQALSALSAEGLEPAEAASLCAHIQRLERGRAVRGWRGFRLLQLACGGKPGSPRGWLLRYAMGRAVAALADPERKPAFTIQATCALLGERTGGAITLLASAGARPLGGGLLLPDGEGQLTLAHGLATWLVGGQFALPGLEPLAPRDWLVQQPPVQSAAERIGAAMSTNAPGVAVLTNTEPLLAAALGAALGRSVRCWSLDDARRGPVQPLTALLWIGALEGFEPMVVLMPDEDRGHWSDDTLRPPEGMPPASTGSFLWIATPTGEPSLPWLRDLPTRIDLAPLASSIALPGQVRDAPRHARSSHHRRRRSFFPFSYSGDEPNVESTELAAVDQRLRLEPLQRAVFPDHEPDAEPAQPEPTDGETEAHLAPELWKASEQTLAHLVLPDEQHQALVHTAARAKEGERCVVLLHGPPGSGKSMAARCLAGSAGLPVYQLQGHLNRDKWFGEQDRKLAEIFEALAKRPGVLVIDEADGWIGRREGSAARQGGAKIAESSAMLLHLERYQGAAVLTTNRIEALDPALQRRVDLDLHLGLPGDTERMALWGAALGDEIALHGDELCLLASVPLTGGDIVATVREVRLKQGMLGVVALLAAARERARRARLWG
jgi:hypothetical protein